MTRIGALSGGRQARRREPLLRLTLGPIELGALGLSVCSSLLAVYLVAWLGLASGEALARTASLGVLWSGSDVSLPAFGIDRPPLAGVLALPFAAVPALRPGGLAAALGTAAAGGLSVLVAGGFARRVGLAPLPATLFVAGFALNPLILYAGAVGLPEALYAALVLAASGMFVKWLRDDSVSAVVGSGTALGFAFLVRYNAVLVALAFAAAYWWVARHRGEPRARRDSAQATALAFATPVAFAVGLWTLIGWYPFGNPLEFIERASELSALRSDDAAIVARSAELHGEPLAVARWTATWFAAIAPLSAIAIAGLLLHGATRRDRTSAALALVLASLLIPEAVALLTGHGQPRVHHLFVAVVPAFAAAGYLEQRLGGGRPPEALDRRRRRTQLLLTATLAAGSMLSAVVLVLLPEPERPDGGLVTAAPRDERRAAAEDAARVATWLNETAAPGYVLIDVNRSAEILLASGRFERFRIAAHDGEDSALLDPIGAASYIVLRERLEDTGPGRIEAAHPDIGKTGGGFASPAFAAGRFRVLRVERSAAR